MSTAEDLVESYVRFNLATEKAEMLDYLSKYGYAVIKNVASSQEIEQGIDHLWDFMDNLPDNKCKRTDSSTWGDSDWYPAPRNGILNAMGTGQSRFAWQARLFPQVKETFAAVWETEDLITSFDGVNVFRPWVNEQSWKTRGSWWHVDQNGYFEDRRQRISVQGFVAYTSASEMTGGFCVLAGSHKQFTEMSLRNELSYMEGNYLKADDIILNESGFEKRLVCCEAGDLVIWDSRTVHCNTPGKDSERDKQDPSSLLRACAYVCMTPLAWATPETLQARRTAFLHNESTTHWPHIFVSSGGKACAHYLPTNILTVLDEESSAKGGGSTTFTQGISISQRLLIDGNIAPDSYATLVYNYIESSLGSGCNVS